MLLNRRPLEMTDSGCSCSSPPVRTALSIMPDLSYPWAEILQLGVEFRAETPRGPVALVTSARKPLWLLPVAQWDVLRLLGEAVPIPRSPAREDADKFAASLDGIGALYLRDDRQHVRLAPSARERLHVLLRAVRGPVPVLGLGGSVYVALYTQHDQVPQVLAVRSTLPEAFSAAGEYVAWAPDSEWVGIDPPDPLPGVRTWCRPSAGGHVRVEEHWTGPSPRAAP